MRITRISVKGLFGMFDHEIPLNQESRITIVHGPNGVGKTVLMRMLEGLIHYDYHYICGIPFDCLMVEVEDGSYVTVESQLDSENEDGASIMSVNYTDKNKRRTDSYSPANISDSTLDRRIAALHPGLIRVDQLWNRTYWLKTKEADSTDTDDEPTLTSVFLKSLSGKLLANKDVLRQYPSLHADIYGSRPDWLVEFQENIGTEFISTTRLTREFENYDLSWALILLLTEFSGEGKDSVDSAKETTIPGSKDAITEIIGSYRFPYGYFYTLERLQKNAVQIDELRAALAVEVVKASEIAADALEEQLSYLMDDNEEIVDDPDYKRVTLFINILNERVLFKRFGFDQDHNFQTRADNGSLVPFSTLSSGEQHLLILYYKLVFEIEPDTLVIIDEPELSMNVVWQRNFLKDLQRIIELRNFDVLIATHSPQIIHDKWDWMVPLGENIENDEAD